MFVLIRHSVLSIFALGVGIVSFTFAQPPATPSPEKQPLDTSVLRQENIVAWCIVPFDAAKRGPAERAEMLQDLEIKRCAYDWRATHVPSFEQEILEYRKRGIEFFAFWGEHDDAYRLFEKYDLHPQIWIMPPNPNEGTQAEKVQQAAQRLQAVVQRTQALGCKLGLYNHGGWGGEPENLVAICQALRQQGYQHVGITYNFHHGHEHIEDWAESFRLMMPYLHCLNLNGMNPDANPKILGISKGVHEQEMIRVVVESGYQGPIGILDHRDELDAKDSLSENLEGLRWLRAEYRQRGSGGAKPETPVPPQSASVPPQARGMHPSNGLFPGAPEYRQPPLTVECQATLDSAAAYNILVSSDEKRSANHWELFSMVRSGTLTAYLPGHQPDHVHSDAVITDGQPHTLSMIYEPGRVRLFVDGKQVADQTVSRTPRRGVDGGLAIGRLVEHAGALHGSIQWVRISGGVRSPLAKGGSEIAPDASTVGLWIYDADSHRLVSHGELPATDKLPTGHRHSHAEPPSPAPVLPYDPSLTAGLAAEAMQQGDAVRGARVFASTNLHAFPVTKWASTAEP